MVRPRFRLRGQGEPTPDNRTALEIVCDTALEWAGEYGFSMPTEANRVFAAVKEVREKHGPKAEDAGAS